MHKASLFIVVAICHSINNSSDPPASPVARGLQITDEVDIDYNQHQQGRLVQLENQENRATETSERLFSSLTYAEDKLKHSPGNLFAATALIAGTTIGAGILAVPNVTQDAGFVAAAGALTGMWVFSVVGGLLLAEVNLNTLLDYGRTGSSIRNMADRTLGATGSSIVTASFIFLHCAMLVAYIARAGELISGATAIPTQAASIGFAATLGILCYGLKPKVMDNVNSALVVGVLLTFGGLLIKATPGVHIDSLLRTDVRAVPKTLPTLSLAFIYQSIVPVVTTSLEGDVNKIRTSVIVGTGIPLLMFLAWDAAILGSLGPQLQSGSDPIQLLIDSDPNVGPLVQVFSFLALVTSFIGFSFALVDYVGDLLKVPSEEKSALPFLASIVPPTLLALTFPKIFFQALDSAGTYGVILLFGVFPALMAWQERAEESALSKIRIIPGGMVSLLLLGTTATAIICNQTVLLLSDLLK